MRDNKNKIFFFIIVPLFINLITFTQEKRSDWISSESVASVIHIGKVYDIFYIANMSDDFIPFMELGSPNFGSGRVVQRKTEFHNIGSGVMITEDGWFITNNHVTDDPIQVMVKDQYGKTIFVNNMPVKMVIVPAHPGFVWISLSTKEEVESGKFEKLRYYAEVIYSYFEQTTDEYFGPDMAICKITHLAEKINNLPKLKEEIKSTEKFIYSNLGNPFVINKINEPYLASVGYPGIGPQESQSITRGNFIGYQNSRQSIINHDCKIAGGNSGGGLFYKDKLIGINTWSIEDRGNTISKAQPVTYFVPIISYCKLLIDQKKFPTVVKLPDINKEWINSDPADDPYKNKVYFGFEIVSRANENMKLKNAIIIKYKEGINFKDAEDFISVQMQVYMYSYANYIYFGMGFKDLNYIANLIMQESYFKIFNLNKKDISGFLNNIIGLSPDKFIDGFPPEYKKYFDIIEKDEFYADIYSSNDEGKVMLSGNPDNKYNLKIMIDGYKQSDFIYTCGDDLIQGPHVIKLENK